MLIIYITTVIGLLTVLLGLGSINITQFIFGNTNLMNLLIIRFIIYMAFIKTISEGLNKLYKYLDFKIKKLSFSKKILNALIINLFMNVHFYLVYFATKNIDLIIINAIIASILSFIFGYVIKSYLDGEYIDLN